MLNNPEQKSQRRSLRRRMTTAERTVWSRLRSSRLSRYKFRRQTSIGTYIVDFYCAKKKLIIEIDGDVHAFSTQECHDICRQKHLELLGFRVLRFTNGEVRDSMTAVLERILREFSE